MKEPTNADILKAIEDSRVERDEYHESFTKQFQEINQKLDPVFKVYSQFTGFGAILKGVFTFIIIPASVILGIWHGILTLIKINK